MSSIAGRVANPIVDLSLLDIPTFRLSMIGALLFRLGVGATPFLLPLLLQVGFGMSPFQSGMITFAVGGRRDRDEVRRAAAPPPPRLPHVLVLNALIAGAFVAMPATFTPATPVGLMTGLLLIGGFFRSLQFTSVNALSFADVPQANLLAFVYCDDNHGEKAGDLSHSKPRAEPVFRVLHSAYR